MRDCSGTKHRNLTNADFVLIKCCRNFFHVMQLKQRLVGLVMTVSFQEHNC